MKKRLLVLSDLWGIQNANWINLYLEKLELDYEIFFYDSCKLAEINTTPYTEENLHQQFVNGGIEKAVQNLTHLEKEEVSILAFSIGGTIAWKAGLEGLKINKIIAISATRLRHETNKPNTEILLIYGDLDLFKPSIEWHNQMDLTPYFMPNENHTLYRHKDVISQNKRIFDSFI
ncbi:MAG: alpha/beta hydrolase [Flavobacteriia bacterium]|nr:alpha/beta hydrolase [Flavobacteriia bacterium]